MAPRIIQALAASGVRAILLKGASFGAWLYDDGVFRDHVDVDLLVGPATLAPARDLLRSLGYRPFCGRSEAVLVGRHAEVWWRGEDVIDLHHTLWGAACPPARLWDTLAAGTERLAVGGSEVEVLGPSARALHVCLHAAASGRTHPKPREDLRRALARLPEATWKEAADLAVVLEAEAAFVAGLAVVPEGRSLIDRLGLAHRPSLRVAIRSSVPPPLTSGLVRLVEANAADRARLALRTAVPTPSYLRSWVPWADRGPVHLAFAYARWPVFVASRSIPALRAVWRAQAGGGPAQRARPRDRPAGRALSRQLVHQERKATMLRGREAAVVGSLGARWREVRRLMEGVGALPASPRIIEVGSGAHGIVFGSGSERAVGVDPLAARFAELFPLWQRGVPTVAAAGEHLPFAAASFDVVLCDNVVDHAESPQAIVGEIARVLAPGGLLYFTVNVHHRLYGLAARAHRAWNAAGVPLEIAPFADHTVHLSPNEARALFDGVPLQIHWSRLDAHGAKAAARQRRLRHPGDLLPRLFFKNARWEIVARRRR